MFAQDSTNTKFRVDVTLLQRSYDKRIDDIKIGKDEKYRTLNYGVQLLVPVLRTDKTALAISADYSKSLPKEWNLLNQNMASELIPIKTELYSIRGHYRFNLGSFLVGVSAGMHQDKLSINNANYFSQTQPGYGICISYTKPIKLFKTKSLIPFPIVQMYKIKDNDIYWSLQIPVYHFPRKK